MTKAMMGAAFASPAPGRTKAGETLAPYSASGVSS